MLLPVAFWAHGASKMALLGASLLPFILQCFRAQKDVLPPGACRASRASARRIVSCRAFALPSCASKSHMRPPPHLGVSGKPSVWKPPRPVDLLPAKLSLRQSHSDLEDPQIPETNSPRAYFRCASTQPFFLTSRGLFWQFSGNFRQFAWTLFRRFWAIPGTFR